MICVYLIINLRNDWFTDTHNILKSNALMSNTYCVVFLFCLSSSCCQFLLIVYI